MSPDFREEAELELALLKQLFQEYGPLLDTAQRARPDKNEVIALAAVLHSFYTGTENLFTRILAGQGRAVLKSAFWHKELLTSVAMAKGRYAAVISPLLHDKLKYYLDFRHAFRQSYGFRLKWEKMAPLVFECREVLALLEKEVRQHLSASGARTKKNGPRKKR